jgi:hypothetical protein
VEQHGGTQVQSFRLRTDCAAQFRRQHVPCFLYLIAAAAYIHQPKGQGRLNHISQLRTEVRRRILRLHLVQRMTYKFAIRPRRRQAGILTLRPRPYLRTDDLQSHVIHDQVMLLQQREPAP